MAAALAERAHSIKPRRPDRQISVSIPGFESVLIRAGGGGRTKVPEAQVSLAPARGVVKFSYRCTVVDD